MRYVCKKCGKFVSQNSEVCKSCGELNPAIPQEPQKTQSIEKSKNRHNGDYMWDPETNQFVEIPRQSRFNLKYFWIAFFVIIFLIAIINNIIENNSSSQADYYNSNTTYNSYDNYSNSTYNQKGNSYLKSSSDNLVYHVNGTSDPAYYWIIKGSGTDRRFEYIITGEGGQKRILESGDCVATTFGLIKQLKPNTVLRNGAVNSDSKVYYMGPLESGTYGFDVYAILVPSGSVGQIFINDGPKPLEFILIDNVSLR